MLTVLYAVLVFGFLIFIHEFGHYIFARIFGVTIHEFSIGMGPKLVWYDSKKTGIRYSLAMLPFGGFVAMAGEDTESDDPNAFHKKPAWQRLIITAAGASINILCGLLVMIILATMVPIGTTTVHSFSTSEGEVASTQESGLRVGDTILSVDGKRTRNVDTLIYEVMRHGHEPVDVVVLRDGEKVPLDDVQFPVSEEQGQLFGTIDFLVTRAEKGIGTVINYAFAKSFLIVRMCWESIFDLITGRYTLAAVSGPVGISGALGDAAAAGIESFLSLVALISINLGVMNLLPLPALDGGRMVTILIELVTGKKIPARIEGIINTVGLFLLLGLSVIILFKDIFQLFA